LDSSLLTRFAENIFWLARYMERIENLARILDVNETYNRGRAGDNDWSRILRLHHDEEEFFKRHEEATESAVIAFYITDRKNPNSIVSCLHFARENARSLRHLISTEMWRQINTFYSRVRNVKAADLRNLNHGRFVQVAGIVTGRQRPSSASGVLFLTLEDETDNINVVIWTRVLEQYRTAIIQGRLLKVKGIVERNAAIVHVIAGQIEDWSQHLDHFALQSRDFR